MYLQTVMVLLRAEGLHSCAQMAWAKYHATVAKVISPPDDLMLFCGMSIGFEDAAVDHPRTGRAPLGETVTFVDAMDARGPVHTPARTTAPRTGPVARGPAIDITDPATPHPPRGRPLPRLAARLKGGFTQRMDRLVSQIGLPPGPG